MSLNRRNFLATTTGALGALALSQNFASAKSYAASSAESFDFVFFTDTHIEPELDAAQAATMCFRKSRESNVISPSWAAITFSTLPSVDAERAKPCLIFTKRPNNRWRCPCIKPSEITIRSASSTKAESPRAIPLTARKCTRTASAKTYYSFDHKGYHFIVLDSIQPTDDRLWEARIDEAQMAWLAEDLKQTGPRRPVIGSHSRPAGYRVCELRPDGSPKTEIQHPHGCKFRAGFEDV